MLARLPIRSKLILALLLWLVAVSVLCWSSFEGLYAFRGLVKHLERVAKLPRATDLERRVSQIHLELAEWEAQTRSTSSGSLGQLSSERLIMRMELHHKIKGVRDSLEEYRLQSESQLAGRGLENFDVEQANLREIERIVDNLDSELDKSTSDADASALAIAKELKARVGDLPRAVQSDVSELPEAAGVAYGQRIRAAWATSLLAAGLTATMLWVLYRWVFRPLRVLIKGSRKVAGGDFAVNIQLDSQDEMAELASAMNEMTHEFRTIRDDLDRQVQERTAQAVRTERLAGVGFLAAGVADEINAPLSVIRDRAKTLEAAFAREAAPLASDESDKSQIEVNRVSSLLGELQAISAAAFRCKEITQSLLDLSRTGSNKRERIDVAELCQSVIDLLDRTGKYASKRIELKADQPVVISANPQEIKQVVLSLLVHRLDHVADGETVELQLTPEGNHALLVVFDKANNRRISLRDSSAQAEEPATIFGLSLAKCIVSEHGGKITVSPGSTAKSGQQERVRVTLPLANQLEESSHQYQVA